MAHVLLQLSLLFLRQQTVIFDSTFADVVWKFYPILTLFAGLMLEVDWYNGSDSEQVPEILRYLDWRWRGVNNRKRGFGCAKYKEKWGPENCFFAVYWWWNHLKSTEEAIETPKFVWGERDPSRLINQNPRLKSIYISPLKLPWWGRAPSNCRGTLSFLYKMGGPGWRHLYKMECAKKTLENDRAPTYTGDSWWIEKFEAISIMFGGHMSMYKNKDSFCRHVPGLQNE